MDAKQVGLEGHSRFGKATLVAMAYDQRFAIAFVSSSGAGGASLFRRDYGEIVENLAGSGELSLLLDWNDISNINWTV